MAVTFESHGYDTTEGNPYTEVAWAQAHPFIGGSRYGVRSSGDWKVTAVSGADRTVSIAPGFGWGSGVTDETFTNDTIQLDPITSGSRYDLIAVRRDWTPTAGESKFIKINGGTTATIPGGRLSTPGGIDDQPIALVRVTAGQTQPVVVSDLRCWATNGGMVAKDDLVKQYLNQLGTNLHINGVPWRYVPGLNDVPEWVIPGSPSTYTPLSVAAWSCAGAVTVTAEGAKKRVTVDLTLTRSGADLPLETASWTPFASPPIPAAARGTGLTKYVPVALIGSGNNIDVFAALNPAAGTLQLRAIENDHLVKTGALFCVNLTYYID